MIGERVKIEALSPFLWKRTVSGGNKNDSITWLIWQPYGFAEKNGESDYRYG